MSILTESIKLACSQTQPFSRERSKALARIKWRLRCGLLYAGNPDGLLSAPRLVGPDDAVIFDGRDNEELKARFYGAAIGCKFEVELCAS